MMKISNFRIIKEVDGEKVASVSVKRLFRKETTEFVKRSEWGVYWRWVSTGEFTPGHKLEILYGSYEAKRMLEGAA